MTLDTPHAPSGAAVAGDGGSDGVGQPAGGRTALTAAQEALARKHWNTDRVRLRVETPWWPMTAWSRASAWQRRPYLLAAQHGLHPDDVFVPSDEP